MDMNMILQESEKLSPEQKLQLLTLLWETYRDSGEASFDLTDEQWNEIDRRETEYHKNEENTLTWMEVKDRIDTN